ncbi:MAG: galactitol-1-phosphate 5-dehydrogenase [Clostridia bacterium]|nr:galactitol-1-phosphate 5-dehydrogenase [Clostridia bacterium]
MKKSTKSANLHAVNDLRYEDTYIDEIKEGDVLVKVKSCGICGSDIGRVYAKGTYHFPTVIGHEFSGVVEYDPLGEFTGKKVVVFPLLPCFMCESCKEGSYATCENYDYYGSRRNGGMAEYLVVKKWNLLVMPDELEFDEGAMCEPVSVARHAILKLDIQKGDNLFVSGAGPIGIVAAQWAKMFGAENVYFSDIDERKIEFAQTFGFKKYEKGLRIDCALEGTGYSDALSSCLEYTKPHGRVVFMGNPAGEMRLSQNTYWHILRKELKISGTWNSSYNDKVNDWEESLKAMAERKINVKPLITKRFPLFRCKEAFEMMKNKTEFYNKVILYMNEDE